MLQINRKIVEINQLSLAQAEFQIFCAVLPNTNQLFPVATQEYAKLACSKTHPCGHPCGGVKNEDSCLPCLHGCDKNTGCLKQDADDMCMICFTEALSAAPAIQVALCSLKASRRDLNLSSCLMFNFLIRFQLDCTHVFHLQCTRRVLENRWLGPRITFGFMLCPICKVKCYLTLSDLRENKGTELFSPHLNFD